ncbi:phosphoserine phosphatase SerB [Phaeovibrio sulfidiphilus]|uniref:Phosphoserine phosphatase n=1 Tax=Phaeovibrio sulfidiphilus TaxID=1220600 RepID=A0A8J6YKS7_9PROT|nr:phosphoserine phosphatase SerB [Phaeovibrio sulfidiphilus]MBE1236445.1 phosphoserine phosphatase SerB [Phaeovibrio sulfidiphilus]
MQAPSSRAAVSVFTAWNAQELAPSHLSLIRDALEALGGETAAPVWLDERVAAEIPVDGLSFEQAQAAARMALGDAPFDVVAQPADGRRKRLLVADMDSTILTGETLDELADHAGLKDKVARITELAMNGELDFEGALRERVAMLKGLPETSLEETWKGVEYTPGARTAIRTLSALGVRCLLVSGGFRFFTARVAEECGFAGHVANDLEIENGVLTGQVKGAIVDRSVKLSTLKDEAAGLGLPLDACASIGDGANDLPMIKAAGLGVAFHAKPSVAREARAIVTHGDLRSLLYLQGIPRSEWVDAGEA